MRRRSFILIIPIIFFSAGTMAQRGIIEGYIMDADSKSRIAGASVNLRPRHSGDHSDEYGTFRFPNLIPGNYELVISHIGYLTTILPVEVKVHVNSSIVVFLKKSNLDLSEIKLKSKKSKGKQTLGEIDLILRPVNNAQDLLRIVPGIFIAQHAGGGKAEQIFLRGYDSDHGTDIQLSVDGMPVNMVSHAHGQGYADLHFLVPETISQLGFEVGPYHADKGNFATAGYVDFRTRDFLSENLIKAEIGQFGMKRLAGTMKLLSRENEVSRQQFYIASEYILNEGFVESPQDFHRFNLIGKYSAHFKNQSQLTVSVMGFDSRWNASGQIPERAVRRNLVSRFGSLDNSEGGNSSRSNFNTRYKSKMGKDWSWENQFYYSRYHFNLYSNFTFYLEDTINGDAIRQRETRNLFGYTSTISKNWMMGEKKITTELGAGFRYDDIKDIELSRVKNRQFLSGIRKGDIQEANGFIYWNQQAAITEKISFSGGIRYDYFRFAYKNQLGDEKNIRDKNRGILSPKLNFSFSPSTRFQVFLNNGIGFHSNDSRVLLDSGAIPVLPKVFGTDLGIMVKPVKNLVLKATAWHFYSRQEFVYVGDAGIVEPSGASRRIGIDLSARYQLNKWLFADADLNMAKARLIGEPKDADYIPLAATLTSIGGLSARFKNGSAVALRYRFMDDRPANPDNSVIAKGYFITDLAFQYRIKKIELFLTMENLFDQEWNEAQFDTRSRLKDESQPVSELHFTPGTPRFLKTGISVIF